MPWPNGKRRQARGGRQEGSDDEAGEDEVMWPAGEERRIGLELEEEVQGGRRRGKRGYNSSFLVNMCAYIVAK